MPHSMHTMAQLGDTGTIPGLSPTGLGQWLGICVMVVGAVVLAYAWRRSVGAAKAVGSVGRAPASAPADGDLARDMTDLTDALAQRLDEQASRIQELIEQADRKIEELNRAAARSASSERRVVVVESTPDDHGGVDPSHRAVYELADAGHAPVEIARRLGRPTGQVELMLNLRRARVRV